MTPDTSAAAVERLAVHAEHLCADTDIAATLRALPVEALMIDTHLCPALIGGFQFRALAAAVEAAPNER